MHGQRPVHSAQCTWCVTVTMHSAALRRPLRGYKTGWVRGRTIVDPLNNSSLTLSGGTLTLTVFDRLSTSRYGITDVLRRRYKVLRRRSVWSFCKEVEVRGRPSTLELSYTFIGSNKAQRYTARESPNLVCVCMYIKLYLPVAWEFDRANACFVARGRLQCYNGRRLSKRDGELLG